MADKKRGAHMSDQNVDKAVEAAKRMARGGRTEDARNQHRCPCGLPGGKHSTACPHDTANII